MERVIKIAIIGADAIAIMLAGCKGAQQLPSIPVVPINYKEKIVERLVPVVNPQDSVNLMALLECNEQNQVVLAQLSEEKSRRLLSSFSLRNNQFTYKAKTARDTVYVPAKDSIVYREVPIPVEVPVEVNKITVWQKTQINAGRILFTLIFAYCIYLLYKWKGAAVKTVLKSILR